MELEERNEVEAATLKLDTSLATMWLGSDGIVYAISKETKTQRTQKEIDSTKLFLQQAAEKGKLCMLVDASKASLPEKRNRAISSENMNQFVHALAVYSTSKITTMMAKIFLTAFPPKYKVKMFTNKAAAREWLKRQMTSM